MSILWIIQIGSWLGIITILSRKQKRTPIAFVPFLAAGFVLVLLMQRLGLFL